MPSEPMSETSRRIIDEHLDEMMSPHEYVATKRALIQAIDAALDAAVEQERERCARIVEQPFTGKAHTEEERWRTRLVNQLAREIRSAAIRRSNHDENK